MSARTSAGVYTNDEPARDHLGLSRHDPGRWEYGRPWIQALNGGDATGAAYLSTTLPLMRPSVTPRGLTATARQALERQYATIEITDSVAMMDEAIEAITDQVFSPLREHVPYARDGVQQMRAQLAEAGRADKSVTPTDLVVQSEHAKMASAEQWMVVNAFRALMPDATVHLRVHRISVKRDSAPPPIVQHGILVTMKHGPFTLRREYALIVTPTATVGAIA